jgi:hypothetical protein
VEGEKEMFVKACMHACFLPTYLTTTPSLLACVISPFEMHNPQRSVSLPTVRTPPRTVAKASSIPQQASAVVLLECLSKIAELTPLPKQPPRGEYYTDKSYYGDRGTYCNLTISNITNIDNTHQRADRRQRSTTPGGT